MTHEFVFVDFVWLFAVWCLLQASHILATGWFLGFFQASHVVVASEEPAA